MQKGSDNTLRVQGEGKRRGKHSSGAPVRHRTRPGTRCRLSSSRANSGVDAEWADHTGGGGGEAGENGSTPELSRPAYLCQRIRARDEPAGSTEFPRRGRSRGAQREGALPAPDGDTALSPTHLNPLMAGTVTTRKHVRTHVLSTQPVWARARQHPSPAPPAFVPPLATPCPSAGRPAPCRDGLVVHMRTLRCTDFGPPTIFPLAQPG